VFTDFVDWANSLLSQQLLTVRH